MRKHNPILIFAAMLAFAPGLAGAALERLEEAFELGLAEVQLPSYPGGYVLVRECGDCQTVSLRTTTDTQFFIEGYTGAVDLRELRAALREARDGAVYVFHVPDGVAVTRIVLSVWD